MNGKKIIKILVTILICIILLTSITTVAYLVLKDRHGISNDILKKVSLLIYELNERSSERQIRTETYKEKCLNIIMTEPNEDNEVENFILEVINTETNRELLITIPRNTKITMSNSLYVELQGETPIMPQIVQLENVFKHAGVEKGPIYVMKILEDFLGIEIGYYTVMPKNALFELLTLDEGNFTISEDTALLLKLPITKRRTMEILKKIYDIEGFMSNMPFNVKCRYIEFYESLQFSDIISCMAEGKNMNAAFIMDAAKVNQMIYK